MVRPTLGCGVARFPALLTPLLLSASTLLIFSFPLSFLTIRRSVPLLTTGEALDVLELLRLFALLCLLPFPLLILPLLFLLFPAAFSSAGSVEPFSEEGGSLLPVLLFRSM